MSDWPSGLDKTALAIGADVPGGGVEFVPLRGTFGGNLFVSLQGNSLIADVLNTSLLEFAQETSSRPGLLTQAAAAHHDPDTLTSSQETLQGTTGGVLNQSAALDVNTATVRRQAMDVRAFLYGESSASANDALRLTVNSATGELLVSSGGAAPGTITTIADVTLGTGSATSLAALNTSRSQIVVQNLDATNNVRVGDTNITATRGIRLAPGESVTLAVTAQVFGRAEAATPAVSVTEIEA